MSGSHAAAKRSSKALTCSIFKRAFTNYKRGNFWPVDKLASCDLLAVPHKYGATASGSDRVSNHVVILNRFGSFPSRVHSVFDVDSMFDTMCPHAVHAVEFHVVHDVFASYSYVYYGIQCMLVSGAVGSRNVHELVFSPSC